LSRLFKKALAHAQGPVPPISERRLDVPLELTAVFQKLLAKEPGERFASLEEVAKTLGPFVAGTNLPALVSRSKPRGALDVSRTNQFTESLNKRPAPFESAVEVVG
jgi:hypothetical protein